MRKTAGLTRWGGLREPKGPKLGATGLWETQCEMHESNNESKNRTAKNCRLGLSEATLSSSQVYNLSGWRCQSLCRGLDYSDEMQLVAPPWFQHTFRQSHTHREKESCSKEWQQVDEALSRRFLRQRQQYLNKTTLKPCILLVPSGEWVFLFFVFFWPMCSSDS